MLANLYTFFALNLDYDSEEKLSNKKMSTQSDSIGVECQNHYPYMGQSTYSQGKN